MSSNAGILIHGQISESHTTHMNAQYAPNNIPTPWPLAVCSVLFSFIICCVGAIPAIRSIDPKYTPPPPKPAKIKPITSQRTTTTASNSTSPPGYTDIELQPAPPYAKDGVLVVQDQKAPLKRTIPKISFKFPTTKAIYYLTVLYCTFRAISAFMINLKSLHDTHTPLSAPSIILLALLSTQIIHCNITHHPITRLLLALDILLLAITFGICSYAPNDGEWWPRYSTLQISSGNCPVYAGDCMSQAPHWLSVGCGDYSTPSNYDNGVSYGYASQLYLPYRNTGDLNVQTSMNPLHAEEMTVVVFGSLWWFFVIFHLLDTFSTLGEIFTLSRSHRKNAAPPPIYHHQQRTIFSTIKSLLSISFTPRIHHQRARKPASSYQQVTYLWICWAGSFLAFVVVLMSIGGHTSQMMKKQHTTYLESFGPQVGVNFTRASNGVVDGVEYWGNATSWSDCFEVRAPGSRSGFWGEWVRGNREVGGLYRVAAGL
ncbi:hypothetical protein EG329_000026 [Mollisiaceae sp. DMI_Dod_QoI]|nr:hypothetical protein EG329_000026 [Helotiales sp. DMI_Dod_QoI]